MDIREIENDNEHEYEIIEEDEQDAKLDFQCSSEGFKLALDCGDGISRAVSQLFSWRQVSQMLIAFDPNMFGILREPLHRVFPEALERLGFHVPGWDD